MSTERARTRAANHARQQAAETKLDQFRNTLRAMQRDRILITYPAVARRSGRIPHIPLPRTPTRTPS